MSQDELYAVTARVVDEFTSAAMVFTALDISNAVKQTLPDARHREISPIVRDVYERRGMGAYTQTLIDVTAGAKSVKAYLYHLPEQTPAMYDDNMRSQLAVPPQRQQQRQAEDAAVSSSSSEAGVRIGKDGRGLVPRKLVENAGIHGDRVLVRKDATTPKLTIVAAGAAAAAPAPVDPLYALPDLFFAATDNGQPLNYEHPSLLHVPRSMLDIFGQDPNLVAKIDGQTVVITKR